MVCSVSQLKQADIQCVPHSDEQMVPPARGGNQVGIIQFTWWI